MYPPPNAYPKYSTASAPSWPPQPPPPPPQPPFQSTTTGIPLQIQGHAPARWSSSLCDCCEDCNNCCVTCWCPCITFGQIADIVDQGTHSCATCGTLYAVLLWFTGFACLYSCCYRTKLRRQYALAESPCPDCLVHCCCEPCALCQEYRELKSKGFDMSIGWHGNLERQSHRVTFPPPMQPGMQR